jgi:protein-tyrosine kinase
MIIEDALDRAKRQQRQVHAFRHEGAVPRPVELKFPRLEYDLAACERNRLLVPEMEGSDSVNALAAYRMLRTRVLHRMRSNRWSTLAITSPGPGDGKSVTALNLALSLARERNQNIFLIDLDMNNPSMCPYLGIAPKHGVLRFFAGEVEPHEVFFSVGVENLVLAGSTETTPFSSELLASGRLETLLEYVNSVAPQSIILLDLPPVLSTDDYLVAAPRADATLLVLSEGRTRRDGVQRAMELLSGFTLAGVVLNRSHERVTDYYGRRYYYPHKAAKPYPRPVP